MPADPTVVLLIIAMASFVPAVIFLAWMRSGVKGRREPWSQLAIMFAFGAVVAVVIALILETIAMVALSLPIVREYDLFSKDPSMVTFLMVVLVAPFVEEMAKVLGLARWPGLLRNWRSGLVFGSAAGLGFAATENLLYEVSALMQGGVVVFLVTAIVRSFSSMLMHGSASSVAGYGMARSATSRRSWIPYYLIAVAMHAAFNLFASFGGLFQTELGPAADLVGLACAFALVLVSVSIVRSKMNS